MLAAISGTLITRDFAERHLLDRFADCAGAHDRPAGQAIIARAAASARRTLGPVSSLRAILDQCTLPIVAALGFEVRALRQLPTSQLFVSLAAGADPVGLLVVPWGGPLDAVWREAAREALADGARWCLVSAGLRLRLVDASRIHARRHLTVDLALAADDPDAFAVAWALLHARALATGTAAESLMARVMAASDAHGEQVCGAVRTGVLEALEHVLDALAGARPRRASIPPSTLYDEALTAVYRALFLFFAEARGLVPAWHPVYRQSYSMEALRADAEQGTALGLWDAFQSMSRLAHRGCEAGDLRVAPFNGRLFAPARAPLLETRRLDDERVRRAVLALSTMPSSGGSRVRVAWHDLGVEELGAIYEGLLDYEPRARRPAVEAHAAAAHRSPAIALVRTDGARRKTTGSFYTPRALTRYLVAHTLEPLVAGRSADDILRLRVVDPAMGSGAFLVEACRYLAGAYEAALVAETRLDPADTGAADRASFRRLVAQRCLYGVDQNPMAVHLARLSLWLTTLAADQPLTFLDHRLAAGDSLVGASPHALLHRTPGARPRPRDTRQMELFRLDDLAAALRGVLSVRQSIAAEPDDTADRVRRKESAFAALATDAGVARWRAACDFWCGAWLDARPPSRPIFETLLTYLMDDRGATPGRRVLELLDRARAIAAGARAFHWPIEFPEAFCAADGRPAPDAGFDAIVGNPPWEVLRADRRATADAGVRARTMRFTRDAGIYTAQSSGHANQFQLFVERATALVRPGGRIGLVVPSALALDHGSARLRRRLLETCDLDAIVGFDNRRGIFPVHRSLTFLLLTATSGRPTRRVRCRFGESDPGVLDDLAVAADDAFPVTLTPALIERLTGPGLAIPDLRSARDLTLVERLTARHPALGSAGGWGARFGRELNATDDRPHFTSGPRGLPVIEGKHVTPHVADAGAARWRIPERDARRLLGGDVFARPRLVYRDVASATNRLTLIAAIVPAGCVTTHTLFSLKGRWGMRDQLALSALLNSYVANYLVRQRVTTHVSASVLERVPVPRPAWGSMLHTALARAAGALVRQRGRAGAADAESQALAATAYGLSAAEYAHVLSTFPLVPDDVRDAALEAFTRPAPR